MRKVIFIAVALVLVLSGIATVAAYESHLINVKAHVENALDVDTTEWDMETVFPQELFWENRSIVLSTSAIAELGTGVSGDLDEVEFEIWAECKPVPAGTTVVPSGDYYAWIGEWLWVGVTDAAISGESGAQSALSTLDWVGEQTCTCGTDAQQVSNSPYALDDSSTKYLSMVFLAPAFENYFNELTDPLLDETWWPSDWAAIPEGDSRYYPDGVDLGVDLKIQVTGITRIP